MPEERGEVILEELLSERGIGEEQKQKRMTNKFVIEKYLETVMSSSTASRIIAYTLHVPGHCPAHSIVSLAAPNYVNLMLYNKTRAFLYLFGDSQSELSVHLLLYFVTDIICPCICYSRLVVDPKKSPDIITLLRLLSSIRFLASHRIHNLENQRLDFGVNLSQNKLSIMNKETRRPLTPQRHLVEGSILNNSLLWIVSCPKSRKTPGNSTHSPCLLYTSRCV